MKMGSPVTLRENSPEPFSSGLPQTALRPAGRPRGRGPGVRASERALRRGPAPCAPPAQPTQPRGPGAPPAPPARRSPQSRVPGRTPREGEVAAGGRAGCTHHSRPSSPRLERGCRWRGRCAGFHITLFPRAPFLVLCSSVFFPSSSSPPVLSPRISLSSLSSSFSSSSSSPPPPPSLQKERKV